MDGIPRHPVLRRGCRLLPLRQGGFLAVTASTKIVLRGRGAGDLIPLLLPLLDGDHTPEGIYDHLSRFFGSNDVVAALRLLASFNLIVEASDQLTPEADELDAGNHFLASYGVGPAAGRSLTEAAVAVIGEDALSEAIVRTLSDIGVGRVRHLNEDEQLIDEVSERLAEPASGTGRDDRRPQLAVVSVHGVSPSALDQLNRALTDARQPWLACRCGATDASIGPLFVPRETGCYNCFTLRRRATAGALEVFDSLAEFMTPEAARDVGRAPGLSAIVAGTAVLEIAKYITGYATPSSLGAELHFDSLSAEMRPHGMLKLPRCDVCGPERLHLPEPAHWMRST